MEDAYRAIAPEREPPRFPFGGGTDRAIARRYLTSAELPDDDVSIERFLDTYLRHLSAQLRASVGYRVHAGAVDLLDELVAHDRVAIGLGTGNVEAGARKKLAVGALDARFAFGGFGCDHEVRAELIRRGAQRGAARLGRELDACRVVVIGDTERDVEAAHAIGATCVGVATGSCSADVLRAAGADHIVDTLTDPTVRRAIEV